MIIINSQEFAKKQNSYHMRRIPPPRTVLHPPLSPPHLPQGRNYGVTFVPSTELHRVKSENRF